MSKQKVVGSEFFFLNSKKKNQKLFIFNRKNSYSFITPRPVDLTAMCIIIFAFQFENFLTQLFGNLLNSLLTPGYETLYAQMSVHIHRGAWLFFCCSAHNLPPSLFPTVFFFTYILVVVVVAFFAANKRLIGFRTKSHTFR